MHRGAIAEIDLNCISHNLNLIRRIAGLPVIAVVKADAYGHGYIEISRRLVAEGVPYLAVAYLEEGVRIREAGINAPILVLFERDEISGLIEYNLIPVIHDLDMARKLSEEAKKRDRIVDVHVKIDTGMGRLGLNAVASVDVIMGIIDLENIKIRGIMSHFSEADMADMDYAMRQLNEFMRIRHILKDRLDSGVLFHIANSAAVFSLKDSHMDAVRPGLALYGYSPFQDTREGSAVNGLRPSMTVRTRILSLRRMNKGTPISYGRTFITTRDSLIAILPVGYADGYMRSLSNNGDVLIKGKRVPVVGRVCMDLTMVDVTGMDVSVGDDVILMGRQGSEEITAWEIAKRAGTIPYEITISLGGRSRRIYR